jgi:hypothetical protein
MNTFDSTKISLQTLLYGIINGKIQLPDFQRGWVWDDDHIRDLLVSIARSFPVGAVMMLETGGKVNFQTRPVEGLERIIDRSIKPESLILDGQQRLTTLTQTVALPSPVQTRTAKGKKILRYYYFDIQKALENPHDLLTAIIAVDEHKHLRSNFGRDIMLDLSSTEHECLQLHFPCNQILNADHWEETLHNVAPQHFGTYMMFRGRILNAFRDYHLPVIQLSKDTSKEAVCLVFEKVNTGGVQLSVFELITASYAADNFNLRDDWYGSSVRQVASRKARLAQDSLLEGIEATDFLQAITMIHTHELKRMDISHGKTGKEVRPVSAKRPDVLDLPLSAWQQWADAVEKGFRAAATFLRRESFYAQRELPYSTQLVPLAAVMTRIGNSWMEPQILLKLQRWFWCGVLGELYGGAVETRIANDYEQLLEWFERNDAVPRTVLDANFQADRFNTLRSRLSAAYKGINILILRNGAKDWIWKATIQELDVDDVLIDIHHIFPQAWCKKHNIPKESYDSILNKTPLSYRTNRKISGDAPSVYLSRIQSEKQVQLNDAQMNELLMQHAINPMLLRTDNYQAFIDDRRLKLSQLVAEAMGKPVNTHTSAFDGIDDDTDAS